MTSLGSDNLTPNLLEIVEAAAPDGTHAIGGPLQDGIADNIVDFPSCADGTGDTNAPSCADGAEDFGSDIRIKTDIAQVGTTVYGLPLYHFRYLTGPERYEGVMAQDVLKLIPEAISTREDGFYQVNYGRLGIRMKSV